MLLLFLFRHHIHRVHVFLLLVAALEPINININVNALPGTWELLVADAGISSMHTAVTHHGTVVLLDRTNNGPTRKLLPQGNCRLDSRTGKPDCYAHSVLLDLNPDPNPTPNQSVVLRPLKILTDTWCSSGQFLPDGTLLQTGGDLEGWKKIRKFKPCSSSSSSCDWEELDDVQLAQGRWYATNQILPDGSVIIVGGRGSNTLEFYPSRSDNKKEGKKTVPFPFLAEAADRQGDNLYPYVHLLPNGHLFVFANNRAVLYDFNNNLILRNYPTLDGGPRNYPAAGSSAMLSLSGDHSSAEIIVCGGAQFGAFIKMDATTPAHGTCGRILATADDDHDPVWEVEDMPFGRIMGDMVMLPDGNLLIINGAQSGSQGFELASNPCLYPVLYRPDQPLGLRFMVLNPGTVPRMYHSTANLLPDARVLLAGSNPHNFYNFKAPFPTELRIEAFSPEYLSPDRANLRPLVQDCPETVRFGEGFDVTFTVQLPLVGPLEVNLASAPFATHSFSQGQRLVKLDAGPAVPGLAGNYKVSCTAPPRGEVAPPGYYMMFLVNQGVPSVAKWLQLLI